MIQFHAPVRKVGLAAATLMAFGIALSVAATPYDGRKMSDPTVTDKAPVSLSRFAKEDQDTAFAGVDSMVTGPTSASFKARQSALNCDRAVWPAIPAACYPD